MNYVIMRKGLSSVLSNDRGWMVWDSFKMAYDSAQNFSGIAVPYKEATQIIADNQTLESSKKDTAFKNKLRMVQNAHTRDLNKDPIETYAEALSRLYFVLKDTVEKMDTALEGAIDYPSELSTSDEVDVRMFLKEADVLIESGFELFVKFSDN